MIRSVLNLISNKVSSIGIGRLNQPITNKINLFHSNKIILDDLPSFLQPSQPIAKKILDTSDTYNTDDLFNLSPDYKQHKYSGRSVITTDDPMRAYYRLNGILKTNNVRKELVRHRYYEKPCLKRRRLKMESNRRRFKEVVSKKVAMVMQLKNRGV